MESILTFLEKIYNTIRYNGFYILLSLFFPLLIWKLDAGNELFIAMSEQPYGNIAFSITAFASLGFSIWAIPTLAIRFFTWLVLPRDEYQARRRELWEQLFKKSIELDNGKNDHITGEPLHSQVPIRYFSILPWFLFIMQCCNIYSGPTLMVFVAVLLLLALWLVRFWQRKFPLNYSKKFDILLPRKNLAIIITFIVIILLLVAFNVYPFFGRGAMDPDKSINFDFSNMHFYEMLLIIVNSLALLFYFAVILFLEKKVWETTAEQFRISKLTYTLLLIFCLGILVTYYFLNNNQTIQYVSPVFVIINMCTALIVLLEFFITSQFLLVYISMKRLPKESMGFASERGKQAKLKAYKFFLIIGTIILIKISFFSSFNEHRIWTTRVPANQNVYKPRLSLDAYFDQWVEGRSEGAIKDSTIYLVSAQGGGSRAAAWAFITLSLLDSTNPHFFENLFSVSTVSGSTSGANMFLAAKYYKYDIKTKNNVLDIYGVNYMSSAFYGLLMGDGLESALDYFGKTVRDRNYHLQQEEIAAFNKAFKRNDTTNHFFDSDYMFPYDRHFPLFMINTTLLDFGIRAVFSPVQIDNFSMARDVYSEFKKDNCNEKRNIPMITCVNQSQAFPLISAYNYIECTGRFGDGGFSENSGCGTTLEIYRALRKRLDTSEKLKNTRIICINMMNSSLTDSYNAPFTEATALTTLTAAMRNPFDGNQNYAYKNLPLQMDYMQRVNKLTNRDTIISYNLDTTITLTRTLSKKSILRMLELTKRDYKLP